MSNVNFYVVVWQIQKFFRRKFRFVRATNHQVSFRKSQINNVKIYKRSREKVVLYNYKNNFDHNRSTIGIENLILNPSTGVARIKNRIVEESSTWHVSDLRIWEPKPLITKKVIGKCINLPDNGFFHFLTEDLPRFLEVQAMGLKVKTIYGSRSKYVEDSLSILNISNSEYFSHPVICQELILSEKTPGGIFTKYDLAKLLIFSKNIKANCNIERIFISRRDSVKGRESRGLSNLLEIESLFSKYNFEILYLEDFSLDKQIALLKGAKIIAGMHGAGLTNLIWNTRKCAVIEISESRITSHFAHLSSIANHEYIFKKSSELLNFSKSDFLNLVNK